MAQYHLTVVVDMTLLEQVNNKLLGLNHGPTFTAPLSLTGSAPATHYWSSHYVDDDQLNKLLALLSQEVADAQAALASGQTPHMLWFYDVEPQDALAQTHLQPIKD